MQLAIDRYSELYTGHADVNAPNSRVDQFKGMSEPTAVISDLISKWESINNEYGGKVSAESASIKTTLEEIDKLVNSRGIFGQVIQTIGFSRRRTPVDLKTLQGISKKVSASYETVVDELKKSKTWYISEMGNLDNNQGSGTYKQVRQEMFYCDAYFEFLRKSLSHEFATAVLSKVNVRTELLTNEEREEFTRLNKHWEEFGTQASNINKFAQDIRI